jgi:SsrA-binding protein
MTKIIVKNRKATFNYDVKDSYLAGIALLGHEVKSIRLGEIDLKGAYVTVHNNEIVLTNAHIKPYKYADIPSSYDPDRSRKLLLNKAEVERLITAKQNGLTIVPLSVELQGKYIKLRIATARGKRKADKRQTIKARDIGRDIQRDLKSRK